MKHIDNLLDLLSIERDAERAENLRELEKYPLSVRETLGKTVTHLQIVDEDVGVGGLPLLILSKHATGSDLSPFHAMDQGDNVLVTFAHEMKIPPMDGTLYDVEEAQVSVAMNEPLPDPLPNGACQLDLLGSDATYKRMRQALNTLKKTGRPDLMKLRDIFMGGERASVAERFDVDFVNQNLNKFQKDAVKSCLAAPEVALVHGPPGTGKTTVLVEIIMQAIEQGKKVLASAPSNIAVDNIVEKLLGWELRMVRLGHPARVLDSLRHVTLSALLEEDAAYKDIQTMNAERHRLLTQLRRKDSRGAGLMHEERRQLQGMIDELWKGARDLEFATKRKILESAHVILSTHGGVGGFLNKTRFDLIVMDEASQSTEPLSWVPISLGKKVVFAGDANQLPPTIYSMDAAKRGLSTTLFDRLRKMLPEELQSMLRVQYRMNEEIMNFSSREFYDNQLIADESVSHHRACDLEGVTKDELTETPFRFIDTVGTGYEETWNELLESRENDGEAGLVLKIVEALKARGISHHQMAIITPYVAQVKKLRLVCQDKQLEIGSIDGFQGREKEVVVVSLVRSNDRGEVGFLSDTRRMNVGLTRARRLLIVVGDSATLSRHPFYREFLTYVEEIKAHHSAWEWIEN